MLWRRATRQLTVLFGVAAASTARAVPILQALFPSDPDALGAGAIVSARDPHGEALRLEHPALLAGAPSMAVLGLQRENILQIRRPARLAGTAVDDLALGATITTGAHLSGMPAGLGVRFAGHRADLAAAEPPMGRIIDLGESGGVATAAIGARASPWLSVGGGLDVAGTAVTPRLEVRVDAGGWSASYAHRVDHVPARLAAPNGVSAARPTPALESSVDLGAASDLVRGGYEGERVGATGAADLSRPGTWDAEIRVRPVESLSVRAERQASRFRTEPIASAGPTAVAGLLLDAAMDRWLMGADWAIGKRHLLRAAYSEGHIGFDSSASDYGRQSARALLGADVDLALFFEQRADIAFQQFAIGYQRVPERVLGFAVGLQALRLRLGPGLVRYGSRLTDALGSEDRLDVSTLDGVAITAGLTVRLRGITIRAAAVQIVPLRIVSAADSSGLFGSGRRSDALQQGRSGSSSSVWDRLGSVLGQNGGSMQVLEVSGAL